MELMEECFKSVIKSNLLGQYCLLIVDGYASYVSNEFIKFIQTNKIIYLCLLPHSTYLWWPLDVSVFGLLKQNYKKLLSEKTCLITYNINKANFILLI